MKVFLTLVLFVLGLLLGYGGHCVVNKYDLLKTNSTVPRCCVAQ